MNILTLNPEAGPNIQEVMALRPISRRQLDLVTVEPKFLQNQGY